MCDFERDFRLFALPTESELAFSEYAFRIFRFS